MSIFYADLRFAEQQRSPQLDSFPETPPPSSLGEVPLPQSTLYGSQGIPLHHKGHSVRINLSQFQLGVGLTPCSLDTLGIVPARSLIKGRFGSFAPSRSYSRSTFKQHYPPSHSSSFHPVIIRGVIPGSPAAVTQELREGNAATCKYTLLPCERLSGDLYVYIYTFISVGDTIQSVNGHSVSLENIDSILAGVSNEVCNSLLYRGPGYSF